MPKYVLPKEKKLSNYLANVEILNGLIELGKSDVLNSLVHKNHFWESILPDQLILNANQSMASHIIPYMDARDIINNFRQFPRSYLIPNSLLTKFIADSQSLVAKFRSGTYELAFRFYIAHDGNPTVANRAYNIVMVPVCSLRNPDGTINHDEDKERTLLAETRTDFFAIAMYCKNGKNFVVLSQSQPDCALLLQNKDDISTEPTLIVYHSFVDYQAFRNGLNSSVTIDNLQIELGRLPVNLGTADKFTIILEFLNNATGPILSTVADEKIPISGICFDQGDLIPPPSAPIADTSF